MMVYEIGTLRLLRRIDVCLRLYSSAQAQYNPACVFYFINATLK